MRLQHLAAAVLAFGGLAMTGRSDEGMWLPNDPPKQLLKEKYGFDLSDEFLRRAMHGSVRFNNGASGGFVSAGGLIVTNHHVAEDTIQKLSTAEKNYHRDGFYARTRAEELKCPDLELNVLQGIEDVTARVNVAVKPDMTPAASAAARRAVMAEIEKESLDTTGLRSDVVTLYQGGLYHLYRYKKYTDVRLVFAPEAAVGGFGGDVDNFEYPRHGFDVSFFRAYENGQPAQVPHFFRWNPDGPTENDLVFVTGHPGTTNRLETLAKLEHRRDRTLPYDLARLRAMEAALTQYSERGPEPRREAARDLHSVANRRKAFAGMYQGLLDPKILGQKAETERGLFRKLRGDAPADVMPKEYQATVPVIRDIQAKYAAFEKDYLLLERGDAFASDLFPIARHVVRMADELPKKSADRLREYRDSNLDSLKFQLFSPAPIYPDLERVKLTAALTFLAENLGGEHPVVAQVLAGKNPTKRADELVAGTKLADPAERKRLVDGGPSAVQASTDPLVLLARGIDAAARALRKRFEEEVEEPERQAYAELAKVRFKVFGRSVAPDATFTLRLAFGTVKGYQEGGTAIPFHTTIGGAFEKADRQGNREPFDLPPRWDGKRASIDPQTPFDFAATSDTIGGNSGSPVLNRAGELVGINFDRNRHGLVRNFVYTDEQARHISVHSRGVLAALRGIYEAGPLAAELTGKE